MRASAGRPVTTPTTSTALEATQDPRQRSYAHMFQFYAENHEQFTGNRNLDAIRNLHPNLQSFKPGLTCTKTA
ncbi:hypothetical protein ACFTSF_29805 [Kribbella sp. NPDC056951]|uniref:hypothetical protein n=1 Tax=Kribbella sp. NPDC056951 TaxID=3345978 RepID=UPI00363EF228